MHYAGRPDAFVIATLTLVQTYHGGEFLALYALLFLIAPLALLACAEGRGWLVPLVSVACYLAAQLYPEVIALPFDAGVSLLAWQSLFFGGLTLGYYRAWFAEQRACYRWLWRAYTVAVMVAAVALLALRQQGHLPVWLTDPRDIAAAGVALPPRSLVLIALSLQCLALVITWFWVPLRAVCGWFVLSLGRNSLWVYLLFLPLIVLFRTVPALVALDRPGLTIAQVVALGALWGAVELRDWRKGAAYRAALPAGRPVRGFARR